MTTRPGELLSFEGSRRRIEEASRYLPGGASSDWRIGPDAIVVDRADGALLWDVDGNRLIDYWCGAGPAILGHDDPIVTEAVIRRIGQGIQLAAESEDEFTRPGC